MIRQAELGDLDAVLPLVRAYREFYQREHDARAEREFIARHLRDGTGTMFVAWCERRAIGFVQLFRTWSTVRLGLAFVLEDLFVEPEARGSGIVDALLERALAFARECGATGSSWKLPRTTSAHSASTSVTAGSERAASLNITLRWRRIRSAAILARTRGPWYRTVVSRLGAWVGGRVVNGTGL